MSWVDCRMLLVFKRWMDSSMRSIRALRERLVLIVVTGLTFLAPAVSAQDVPTGPGQVPRFEPAPCPTLTGAG